MFIEIVFSKALVYAVAISPNQKLAAIGCEDGSIKLLDIFTRKLLYTFKKVHDSKNEFSLVSSLT